MSMLSLITSAHNEAQDRGKVLIAELGLKTDRQMTLAITRIEAGIVHGQMVTPSLAGRYLPEKPNFCLSDRRLPIAIDASSVFSLMSLAVKPKSLDPDLRTRLAIADEA